MLTKPKMGNNYEKPKEPFDLGLFREDYAAKLDSLKSPKELSVSRISHSYANTFVEEHHYLRRKVYIARNVSYGLMMGNYCVGVAMFGYPVWTTYPGLCPPLEPSECPELIRLCTMDGLPKNTTSWFLSHCLRRFKNDWQDETGTPPACVTSFCDNAFGFDGAIYRATNFDLFRKTSGRATNPGQSHGKWRKNDHEQKAEKTFYVKWFR